MSTLPLYDAPKVGGDVLAYCAKCKVELAHVVVSMIDRKPAKCMCKTCKGTHNYKRIGDTTTRASAKTPRAPRAKKTYVSAQEYWDEKMAKQKGKPMRPYKPIEAFKKDEVINHTVFGMGIIEEVRQNGKIVVLFRDGEKILVHNLTQNAAQP